MFAIPKSDPLDVLVFSIGLRLTQLAKMGDPKFKKLLENRNFTIQMGSEAQDLYRTFTVANGRFSQTEGKTDNPTLSINFKDSMTGAKLLTKGDAAAFMVGVQNGDVKMAGDYSLLMWFNQVAKYIVPKVPEQLQPAVEIAKPLIAKATPIAKDLCEKGMALLAEFGLFGASQSKKADENSDSKSKYFNEKSEDKSDKPSVVETAKEKLHEVKAEVEEKVSELKEKAEEKIAEVKDKAEEAKADTQTKVADVKDKAEDLTAQAKDTLAEVKSEAETKVSEVKEKAEDLKTKVGDKSEDLKEVIKQASEKDNATANLTPAQKISQQLEEKHAGEKVIAENVKIDAVKNENSPVTDVMVTRASDPK